jgi:DNA-binding transcriptional LysR family regulator
MATSRAKGWSERIGRRIKLRDLHFLLALSDTQNMGRAATRLAVSRPVVSKVIVDLESTLGVELFERRADGVQLTRYGHALVKWSAAVFDDLRQGVDEINFLADPSSGQLRVGCPEVIASGILPEIIRHLSRKYPRSVVQAIHISHMQSPRLLFQQLRERTIDVMLGPVPERIEDQDLEIERLCKNQLFVVAGRNSQWARKRKISLAELLDEPWILPPADHLPSVYLADAFRAEGLPPPSARVISNSTALTMSLLGGGQYLALRSEIALHFEAKERGLVRLPISLPPSPGPVAAVSLKGRAQAPLLPEFVGCARHIAQAIGRHLARGPLAEKKLV